MDGVACTTRLLRPWGCKELDMTERLHFPSFPFLKGELSTIFCGLQYLSYDRIYSSSFPKIRCKSAANPCAVLCSVVPNSLRPHGLEPARVLCPWNFPGKNTGVGCHCLLQGISPTQGSNPYLLGLLYWQADSLPRATWKAPDQTHQSLEAFSVVPFNLHSPPHQRVCPLLTGVFKVSIASYVSFGSLFKNHPVLLRFLHLLPYIYMYSPKIILIPIVSVISPFSFLILHIFTFFSTTKFLRKLLFFSKEEFGTVFSLLLCFYYSIDCTFNLLFLPPGLFWFIFTVLFLLSKIGFSFCVFFFFPHLSWIMMTFQGYKFFSKCSFVYPINFDIKCS